MDLTERLVAAVEAGESRRSAARRFGVSAASAVKWVARARAEGRPLARRMSTIVVRPWLGSGRGTRRQHRINPRRLVFDEAWAKTNMTRTHGRARCGGRVVFKAPMAAGPR